MSFITKANGSVWSNDEEMYTVNLLPTSSSNSLHFYNSYAEAKEHGKVCGVVIENFDYTPKPEIRNYFGISIGMRFTNNDDVIGKSIGFTHSTICFHQHKNNCLRNGGYDEDFTELYFPVGKTLPTLGTSDGVSSFRMKDHANKNWNFNKPGTQIMWVNGKSNTEYASPSTVRNTVKGKILFNNQMPERRYRPTNWVGGVPTGLTGANHPHEGTSLFVIGDENKVKAQAIVDTSMTDILALESGQLTALNKRKDTLTKDLSTSSRITFAINPSWKTNNGGEDLDAMLFIPTVLKTAGSGAKREVLALKNNNPMQYLYVSGCDSSGKATTIPVRLSDNNWHTINTYVSGVPENSKFQMINDPEEIEKYLEQDKYKGDPFIERTCYVMNGGKALTINDSGTVSLAAKTDGNKYQQWKIVRHSTGAYSFYNAETGLALDNGILKDDKSLYSSPQRVGSHKFSTSEDNLRDAFNISGSADAATIKACVGNWVLTGGSTPTLQSSGSDKWVLDSVNTGHTTGFIIKFTNLKANQLLPLFYVEYFLDKDKIDTTVKLKQSTYIVEGNPRIDVSTGEHTSTSFVQFIDMRTGVIKETVNTKKITATEMNDGYKIEYTMTFNNIYDDQRFLKVKCAPPVRNDKNGTDIPSQARSDIVRSSLKITSSQGTTQAAKYDLEINENDGAIYAKGVMEPAEVVSITYEYKIWNLPERVEDDNIPGYYVRNNCTLILDRMVKTDGDVVAAVDANGDSMGGENGLRIESNRVETYIYKNTIPPDTPITTPPPPDTPITTPPTPPPIGKSVNRVSNNVGEDHTWTITTEIPPRGDYPTDWHYAYDQDGYEIARWREDADLTSYTITDQIDSRLDYRGNLKVLFNGSDITSNCTINRPSVNFAGGSLTVSIQNSSTLEAMGSGGTITVMYNTRINSTADPMDHIENQATRSYTGVKYSRGGTSSWSGSGTTNKPYVYTGYTETYKYNVLNHDYLKGAVIAVYTADGHIVRRRSEYPVNYGDEGYDSLTEDYLVRTVEGGLAYFYGLKDGTYYFKEVSPPRGFEWNKGESARTRISGGDNTDRVEIPNNPYQATTVEKTVDKNEWLTHEIHTWTVTGHIPQYFTDEEYAECQYQFIDEIDYQELDITKKRLDYRGNVKVFVAGSEMRKDYHYSVQEDAVFDSTTGRQRVIKLTVTMLPPGITAISDAAKNGGWQTNTVVLQFDTSINERAHEHEIIPNRVELNYCGFGVRRYAKSDLRIIPSENPLDVWDWNSPDTPGYPHEFGEPGGHLVKTIPEVAEERDEYLIDDPYVYTGYRELRINCIIDQKYDPYEDISFTYDIDGYPCYDKTKKLHWTVIINPNLDGDMIEATVWDTCETKLYRSKAQYGNDILIYLPPGTYTVNQRKPMRYDLVESKPEVENAYKLPGTSAIENNLIQYHDAEDTFVNVLRQWNMHSSAFLEKNEPGLREKLRGYLNVVLINGPKDVSVINQETGDEVYSGTKANVHCIKIDYGTYEIYVDGSMIEQVDLQQYSMQRRYILSDD